MTPLATIIAVDDDPDILEQVTIALHNEPYRLVIAGTREEAESLLLGVKPDLAILDLMMEHTDSGFVLCHHLKQLHPEAKVIMLTAVAAQTGISFDAQSAQARGWIKADKILDKPVRPEQLKAEIRRLLKLETPTPAHH